MHAILYSKRKLSVGRLLIILATALLPAITHAQFPEYKVTPEGAALHQGFLFMSPFKMRKTNEKFSSSLLILDSAGNMVFFRPGIFASDFKLHPDGRMSYFNSRCHILLDSSFKIIDSVSCVNGAETDSHDFLILPNGNYVLIGMRSEIKDMSWFSITQPEAWRGGKRMKINRGIIQVLDRKKNLLHEWDSKGCFAMEDINPVYFKDTSKLDIPHFNSVDVAEHGNFLVSARYTDDVVYVERKTNTVLWRLGGKRNSFKMEGEPYPFLGQHDARFLPDGNILLFDNGYSYRGDTHNARSVEYKLDMKNHRATCVSFYEWDKPLVSEATGSTQRLHHGMTLTNFGKIQFLAQNVLCTVSDSTGNKIFDLSFADTMGSYRTWWYPELPFAIARPEIISVRSGKTLQLMVAGGESCIWSNGQRGASITVTEPGNYYVMAEREDGSFMGSVPVAVSQDMLSPIGKTE